MQKFIVTSDGHFRYGDVGLHKHLLKGGGSCIGGGVYEFDYVGGKMLLSGRSYDFGRVKWSYIDKLILPKALEGLSIYYEDLPIENFVATAYE